MLTLEKIVDTRFVLLHSWYGQGLWKQDGEFVFVLISAAKRASGEEARKIFQDPSVRARLILTSYS